MLELFERIDRLVWNARHLCNSPSCEAPECIALAARNKLEDLFRERSESIEPGLRGIVQSNG